MSIHGIMTDITVNALETVICEPFDSTHCISHPSCLRVGNARKLPIRRDRIIWKSRQHKLSIQWCGKVGTQYYGMEHPATKHIVYGLSKKGEYFGGFCFHQCFKVWLDWVVFLRGLLVRNYMGKPNIGHKPFVVIGNVPSDSFVMTGDQMKGMSMLPY